MSRTLLAALLTASLAGCDALTPPSDESSPDVRLYPVELDGQWGYVDERGRMAIAPQFASARAFSGGLAPVRTRTNWRWGYIDRTGTLVGSDRYQETRTHTSGLGAVRLDNRWGFVDADGRLAIDPRFHGIDAFSDGYAWVRLGGNDYAYVRADGRTVEPPEELGRLRDHEHTDVHDGLALVQTDDGFRFLRLGESDGSTLFDQTFADARPFHDGVAPVLVSDRWGLVDESGAFVVSPRWVEMGAFGDGLAPVRTDGNQWGFVDPSGRVAIAPAWDEVRPFREGRAAVRAGNRWGFVDRDGREVVAPRFDEVHDFKAGAAAVLRFVGDDTHRGYIDADGEWLWYPTD
jgi:hypothetical protein